VNSCTFGRRGVVEFEEGDRFVAVSILKSFVSITHRVLGSVSHLVFPSLLVCLLLVGGFSVLFPHSCSVGFTAATML
jgi:hypothetical protein